MGEQGELFEAPASAVGYLYQVRKALLFCVEQIRLGLDWSVEVEAGDDIEVRHENGRDLWQLKHRAPGTRVTDMATDLWKSLRIWATAWSGRDDVGEEPAFFLLTTADAPAGSAAYHLRPPGPDRSRDEAKALELLNKARAKSTNRTNEAAYRAWDALSRDDRRALLSRVQVLDAGPDVERTTAHLIGLANVAVGRDHAHAFLQRLDGWFFQRILAQLRDRSRGPVTGLEFDQVFSDRRDEFRRDNLPIDADVVELEGEEAEYGDKVFVRQLGLIGVGENRVRKAVRDYLRAFTQRSRWVNDNLVRAGELGRYERRLVEEWRTRFDIMCEDLGEEAAEDDKRREARAIYRWVEAEARFPIRSGCDEPFVTTGSFHMLADRHEVGWHPDFVARLMALLEPTPTR
ncbi:hypothetical protein GCM10010492_75740 [Saccharothrix mutabilis subsp. mutabilis]|uniref:ABC-three component systems C-terminal domain-containing protein n=1 Tax=Saccharothrix mutabilis subsp. mutabilis TaxID=66855 RepID=A0ABN0UWU1_9PSEU